MAERLEQLNLLYDRLEDYQNMLSIIPENSVLGRLCVESYIRKTKRQIQKLLR